MDKVGIGIIGCGNISDAYLKAIVGFPLLEVRGVADIRPEAALAAAAKHGLKAQTMDALLRDDGIEIVVNLTIPAVHVEVGLQVLAAGKHVHSEKPLGLTVADARAPKDRPMPRPMAEATSRIGATSLTLSYSVSRGRSKSGAMR